MHADQIRALAAEHGVALVDSLNAFRAHVAAGGRIDDLLSQTNHPNRRGHDLAAALLLEFFPVSAKSGDGIPGRRRVLVLVLAARNKRRDSFHREERTFWPRGTFPTECGQWVYNVSVPTRLNASHGTRQVEWEINVR